MPLHGEIVVIKRNGTDGTHFPLTATSCLFGRKTECDIRIQLPHVSKEHCKVEVRDNGEVFVTNMSTVNPTQLNGTTVKQPARLKHGDIITIIDRSFRFEKPSAKQGKRRSTGLDSDTFKVFASNQSSDTNKTERIETLLTSRTQRKSEGNVTKTTHSRRSLQNSSSAEPKNDLSPFGELYEMLKNKVGSEKRGGKTPVKDKSSSPKNVALKRSLQIQDGAQSPVAPKRSPRRSHSSDSPITRPKEVVEPRSASAGRVREASKSPSRSPKTSTKALNVSAQEPEQTPRRSSGKQNSLSVPQEQAAPIVNGNVEKPSPRRSASAKQNLVITQVHPTPKNAKTPDSSPRRRSNQSVPEQPVLENKDSSTQSKSPTRGRQSASLENVQKGTPNKSPVKEDKTSEAETRQPQRKRRSDELSLPDPPPKRKRVSFGGHLSPELFDKRLPPNSPLKKGATPARRSLSLNSPRTVIRKSFGLKQSVIREVFERSESSTVKTTTPTRASQSSPSRSSSVKSSPAVTDSAKSPTKQSSLVKTPSRSPSARISVSEKSPVVTSAAVTPVKNSPDKKPLPTTSVKMTPGKKSLSAKSPVKSPSKSPQKTPAKSPSALSVKPFSTTPVAKTPSPAKRSPVAKTPTPAKKSPVAKTPSPAKRSPVAKTPSQAKTPTPAKKSPVAKTPSPAKRSPVAKTPTLTKRSPVTKTPPPAKRSPVGKTPTPAKRSPVAKTPSRPKTPTPAKRSPVAKTPSRAKTPSPAKRSPVVKTPSRAKMPSPAKRSPVATPTTPATPYVRGRFSVSRIDTPPQERVPSELPPSQTPVKSRKSLSMKKTPRRSRKLEAFELIRSKRRSGATEANLFVSRTWADVVKIGVAKSQKKIEKIEKPVKKVAAMKKKLKHKTPMKKFKDLTSTGHADSPATILVGRAHTRMVDLTGRVPKVVRNQAVKLNTAHNESFTGVADLFSTPVNSQRKSNRLESSKTVSPSSAVVEVSVMQTPEESGEMVVSPLNSPNTTRRKKYGQDAISRLLQSPASPKLRKEGSATLQSAEETSKSQKDVRKSVGLSGVKRIMRTPKQKAEPVTDPRALRKLLRTPKETESPRAYSRRSANLEVLGIDRLVKTPKQKELPVEDFSGLQRIMKTPKQRSEPVEVFTAVKRIMRSPKEKVQPVEDMIGLKRIMRTPKEKSQPVEDMVGLKRIMRSPKQRGQPVEDMIGIKRIMSTPKEKGQPVEDFALNHLMNTPVENAGSTESTRPIEEIFGIRNLIKTPPKSSAGKEVASTDPSRWSANALDNSTQRARGRPAKRLNLQAEATSGNDVQETVQVMEEPVIQSNREVVKSVQKRGRPSKVQSIFSPELPNDHVSDGEVTSPRRRGRQSSAAKSPKESRSTSDSEVTSSPQQQRSKSVADKVTSPARKGRPSTPAETPKEQTSDAIEAISPRRRGRPSSTAKAPKESLSASDAEVTSPAEPEMPKAVAEAPKDAVSEVTSPRRRGRPSSTVKSPKESLSASDTEVTSPSRRGKVTSPATKIGPSTPSRSKAVAEALKESAVSDVTSPSRRGKVTSPAPKGRPSTPSQSKALAEVPKESDAVSEVTSPRLRGRPSSTARESLLASTRPEIPVAVTEPPKENSVDPVSERTSPRHRGRPSSTDKAAKHSLSASDAKMSSPRSRERPSSTAEEPLPASEAILKAPRESSEAVEVASPRRRGRPSTTGKAPKESLPASDAVVASPTQPPSDAVSEVTSPRRRGRLSANDKAPNKSLPASDAEVTSPRHRGRQSSTGKALEELPTSEAVQLTSPITAEVLKESLPVFEVTSPTRRGRPKKTRVVEVEESVPISKSKLKSPTHNKKQSTPAEIFKDSVTEAISPTRSRVVNDPIPVAEGKATSQTRRGRPKTKVDLPQKLAAPEVQVTHDELPTTQTRRGRPKASVQVTSVPAEDVSSPTRGSRSKGISEAPKDSVPALNDTAISQKRRGRAKVAEVTKESQAVDSEFTSSTRGSRSKDTADAAEETAPAVEEVTSQKRRGRFRKADVPKESEVTSPVEEANPKSTENGISAEVTAPTHRGRLRNTEVSKETAPVPDGVSSRRRKAETTAGELDLAERPSEEKTAKSTKKTARQNVKSSKQVAEELLQAPEPEETVVPVAENKTQLPPVRGRRKATQNEPVLSEDTNPGLEDKQPEEVNTSPVARRGGRRKNTEDLSSIEPDVAKPKTSKQETRGRGRSKAKGLTEENVVENTPSTAPEEPVKSPQPKSPKRSAQQTKELPTEPPVESQPKSLRGRSNRRKNNSPEASNVTSSEIVVPEAKVSQKSVPARGRSRTTRDINVSVSDADEQTKGSNSKQQRASRRNHSSQEDASASPEEQVISVSEVTESSTRGSRGKKRTDSDEPHSSPEVKGRKNARGKIVKNAEEQTVPKSKTKSVQWHPLLDTDVQSTVAAISTLDSNEASPRVGRSKGKTRPDALEPQVPAKRSRRGNKETVAEEPPASSVPETLTVSEDVPLKRGRKATLPKKDEAVPSTASTEVVHASPQRGRRGASSKVVENNEVHNIEPSTSRRQRGAAARGSPAESESTQSPVKPKSQKAGSGKDKSDDVSAQPTRGVKRKLPNSEVKSALVEPENSSQASESVLVETENIPAGRGRKNTKLQKVDIQEALSEKPTMTSESPAKKRKTDAATTATQKRSSRQQTSKLENEKPSTATKTRASTRSRK